MPVSPTDEDELNTGTNAVDETKAGTEGSESGDSQGSNDAKSPAAETQDDKKPANIADAVRAALDSGKEQSSGSGEGEEKPGTKPDPKAAKAGEGEEEELGELTEEELASLKGKTRRRLEQFAKRTKEVEGELAKLKPEADNFRKVQEFVNKARLTPEDVNTGMNIMALMKNDPVTAYEKLTPIYESLKALVGGVLPNDLQVQVTEGKITQAAAQELARLRASTGLTAQQREQQAKDAEADGQRQQNDASEKLKDDVGNAITEWENRWKASDPDYSLKHARVSEAIELELHRRITAGTLPTNVKDAVKMANEIKAKVEKELLKFVPRKQATGAVPQVPGSTNNSKPVAKNIHDAVAQAVGFR